MRIHCCRSVLLIAAGIAVSAWSPVRAGDLSVDVGKAVDISMVGAVKRWDEDGKPRFPVDPKAKIAEPRVDARGVRQGSGKWIFRNLPPGRYDLVILGADHLRVEGFRYPPITEFDPFLPPAAGGPEEETREWIVKHIAGSKHYENKVVPLFLAGDEKQVRILVQLVRDQATSFDADFGAPVATVRHEVWQYSNQYGGWVTSPMSRGGTTPQAGFPPARSRAVEEAAPPYVEINEQRLITGMFPGTIAELEPVYGRVGPHPKGGEVRVGGIGPL